MADTPLESARDATTKQKLSCYQCKARKLKCEREWPCKRCVQLGEECQFPQSRQRPGSVARRPRVKELEARLKDLEYRMKNPQPLEDKPGLRTPPMDDTAMIPTGRFEQLPPQSVLDELTNLYFQRLHSDMPMHNPALYMASLHRPVHMQPPMCLQYIILALAANLSPEYEALELPFYHRARNYIHSDEMKGDGNHSVTLAHAQCWVLLGYFEGQHLWFTRAAMSVSKSVRLAQMLGLYNVETADGRFALAPSNSWQEKEERRRTMWAIFCTDRMASSTTGWHPLIDAKQVSTFLPASDEAFQLGTPETPITLHEALDNSSSRRFSMFACRVLTAHLYGECLEHTFAKCSSDDPAAMNEFWKRHQSLDNRLATLFMSLPDGVRCPENAHKQAAVLINLNLHMAVISIHRVAAARSNNACSPFAQLDLRQQYPSAHGGVAPAERSLASAHVVFSIITTAVSDADALFVNPFVAFAAFMAALAFLEDFLANHSPRSEECLGALMDIMVAMAGRNLVTASLAIQLAQHLNKSRIDNSAMAKVQHLMSQMGPEATWNVLHDDDSAAVTFCPFEPIMFGGEQAI
ncbi:fungal-specific transcription factor domain-containing protein [Xylariales sp. PMI_506]|nr:fungal-specific transcription factor domain-containing protein [Xylariales sp. PMI_506]